MNSALPKLREGVTIRQQESKGEKVFIVKEPVNGQFFRFGESEEFIIRQFDGRTPLANIQAKVQERFGEELELPVLNGFIDTLQTYGVIGRPGEPEVSHTFRHPKRLNGSLLYLRFRLFDPTWIFDRLQPRIRFLFSPFFVAFSALAILLATDTAVVNASDLTRDIYGLFDVSNLPLYLFFTFLTVGLHEFAHGLTCRHFGGEVHELGFLLMYFQPALYCNISDAWLFPEKSKRLWVSFAGPYFELFIWALATLIWHTTESGSLLNQSTAMIIAISGIKTLMNFNPFIKLDGYYMLSDFLEIPNLQQRSFQAVGELFARRESSGTPHERRIFLSYGSIALGASLVLIGSLCVTAVQYMGDNGESILLAVPLVGALAIRAQIYTRMFSRNSEPSSGASKNSSDPDIPAPLGEDPKLAAPLDSDGGLGELADIPMPELQESKALIRRPKTAPTKSNHEKPEEQPERARRSEESTTVSTNQGRIIETGRKRFRWKLWFVFATASIAIGALLQRPMELRVHGAFSILPVTSSDVRVSVEGIIERVNVREGERISAGDLVATLSDRDLRANADRIDAQIREASARLRMLEAGPTGEEVAVAESTVAAAADQVKFGERKLARGQALLNEGLVAESAVDDLRQQASASASSLESAKAHLAQVLKSVRPEQIDEARAQIDSLATDQRLVQLQMRSLKVLSSVSGVVGTPQRQLNQLAGQFIRKGDPVLKVYDFANVKAQMLISEKDISPVRIGQPIELKVRAYPDSVFHGEVTFIATSANDPALAESSYAAPTTKPINSVLVTTEIINKSLLLKPEMTGEARINCGGMRLADLLIWHVERYFKVDSLSF